MCCSGGTSTRAVTSQSCGQLTQWFGQAQQPAGQLIGDAASQLVKGAADFAKFSDKSKQFQRNFTMAEVAQCTGQNGRCLYIVCDGKVLNLTDFVPYHVGGSDVLLKYAGRDASAAMRASGMPPQVFDTFLNKFVIGYLVPPVPTPAPTTAPNNQRGSNCGWFATSVGLCEYIVKIEKIYHNYKGLVTRIFIRTGETYDQIVRRYGLTNITAAGMYN